MSVPHDPPPTIFGRAIGVAGEKIRYLGLDRSRKQRTRALTQNVGERIGKDPWLGKLENVSLGHGVSLVWDDFCQRYFSGFLAPMVGSCLRLGADRSSRTRRRLQPSGSWKQNGPRGARHSAQIIAPHTCIR
jgi:hypothetical protein